MDFAENEAIEGKTKVVERIEEVYNYNENEESETIVVPTTTQYKDIDDKNVRLVQIRLPSSTNVDGRSWLNLVQNT